MVHFRDCWHGRQTGTPIGTDKSAPTLGEWEIAGWNAVLVPSRACLQRILTVQLSGRSAVFAAHLHSGQKGTPGLC